MQGAIICIIGILITTFSFTQVEMSIQDVDTDAGTLNIYMKNVAGCSYCTDPQYDNEENCFMHVVVSADRISIWWWMLSKCIKTHYKSKLFMRKSRLFHANIMTFSNGNHFFHADIMTFSNGNHGFFMRES